MKNGFVLSIDIMFAMTLFVGLLYSIQLGSQTSQNINRELFLRESAFLTASDCLLMADNALRSKNESLINQTVSNCTQRKTNILVTYYDKKVEVESVLEVQNFEGNESVSVQRLLTVIKGSSVDGFIIAILEVEP